jgi:6-phosphogluconolactonase/glucosamine-6-phosphate isomerase/deaminase
MARIQKARTTLLLDHPFFGTLLFRLGARARSSIATMATDGVSLYFNPEFVDSLSSAELIGVLAHETMHPALQHHTRRGGRDAPDPELICSQYAQRLQAAQPQLCLLGIGENGHLAFNDPAEANFGDPRDVKIVRLDAECRQQQVGEGWFSGLEEVPSHAITVTIPALMRVPRLIVSVPGPRKAAVMWRTVEEAISTACPATILRNHPDVTVYLDRDSAARLESSPLAR